MCIVEITSRGGLEGCVEAPGGGAWFSLTLPVDLAVARRPAEAELT